jgi:hypothetical protein
VEGLRSIHVKIAIPASYAAMTGVPYASARIIALPVISNISLPKQTKIARSYLFA